MDPFEKENETKIKSNKREIDILEDEMRQYIF
jgi:hypothetical protein